MKPDPDLYDDHEHEHPGELEEEEDYDRQMMEVQPDIVTHDDLTEEEEHDHHDHDQTDSEQVEPHHRGLPVQHPAIKDEGVDPIATN